MDNIGDFIMVLMITAGAIMAFHGFQISRDKRKPKVFGLEKQVLTVMAPPDVKQMRQALGRMRMVYGVVLITIALWALVQG